MNKTKIQAALLCLFAFPGIALAGFEVVDGPAPAPSSEVVAKPVRVTQAPKAVRVSQAELPTQAVMIGGIMHTGRKPAIIQPARGFAKGVTMKEALGMIVPSNIQVYNDGQVNLNTTVSWSAKDADDWVGVLDQMLRNAGVTASLDWNSGNLTLVQQRKVAAPAKAAPIWKLTPEDRMVRTALSRWSKQAGYTLDWDIPVDFPIPYEVSYQGEFEAAVSEVMASLKGTDYPVQSCSYENNAIRIVRFGDVDRCKVGQ